MAGGHHVAIKTIASDPMRQKPHVRRFDDIRLRDILPGPELSERDQERCLDQSPPPGFLSTIIPEWGCAISAATDHARKAGNVPRVSQSISGLTDSHRIFDSPQQDWPE